MRSTILRSVAAVGVLAVLAVIAWRGGLFAASATRGLSRALVERGRVVVIGAHERLRLQVQGTTLLSASDVPQLMQALRGRDGMQVSHAMQRANLDALLVDTDKAELGATVGEQLAGYRHVHGLRCLYLDATAALYAPDPIFRLPEEQRVATAVVARALLGGARLPKISSFPQPLRAPQPVEVMVLLRKAGHPRLWRSARGNTIAAALLTAASVARERWQEREQAMGGSIDALLPAMDVEVALLGDDGTIGEVAPTFIDRVFFAEHGVAYERKGAWRYLLPDATADAGKGRASNAYRKLFVDDGLPEDSFGRSEVRLYRLIVQTLALSAATPRVDDGLAPVKNPDEVLDDTRTAQPPH